MQSVSASPGIAIPPRSIVQVRMPDDGSTGSGAGEGETVSMVSAGRMNRPRMMTKKRWTRSTMRNCLGRPSTLTVPEEDLINLMRGLMNADCTHVCVCPLSDCEEGVKRFCNETLKLFQTSKAPGTRQFQWHIPRRNM